MASRSAVYIICSDQPRNGKSLLARVLSDFLLLDARDPFLIDISHPEGNLRNYFPGRTVLVDFGNIRGQMKAFDTIMQAPGRDYVIDVSSPYLDRFCEAAKNLNLSDAFHEADIAMVVFYIVDSASESLKAAAQAEKMLRADIFVPVRNSAVGSALPSRFDRITLNMPRLDPELHGIIENRRFSLRTFLQGDEADVPVRLRPPLKEFLRSLMTELGAVAPALSLARLHRGAA